MKDFRKKTQSLGEEIGNSITHGIGFLLALVGTILLLIKANNALEYVASSIFGIGLMLLYINSSLYHAFKKDTTVKRVFKRFDHISIYILISATFAPILLLVVKGKLALYFFIGQWILTIIGVISKAVWPTKFQILHIILFLLIGWSGLFFISQIYSFSPLLMLFIALGGVSYTIGVLFYAVFSFKFHHFLWHLFVLGGSILHFLGVYLFIL